MVGRKKRKFVDRKLTLSIDNILKSIIYTFFLCNYKDIFASDVEVDRDFNNIFVADITF